MSERDEKSRDQYRFFCDHVLDDEGVAWTLDAVREYCEEQAGFFTSSLPRPEEAAGHREVASRLAELRSAALAADDLTED